MYIYIHKQLMLSINTIKTIEKHYQMLSTLTL